MSAATTQHPTITPEQAKRWQEIKGSIADAIRERLEKLTSAVDELDAHMAGCKECQTCEIPYRLCPTGNRLFQNTLTA